MKTMQKTMSALLAVLLLVSAVTGCKAKEKTYEEDGFSITMSEGFTKKDLASVTYYYESTDALLTVLKEEFTLLESVGITKDSTLDEYIAAVEANNQTEFSAAKDGSNGNYKYFTYTNTANGKDFFYLGAIFKGSDAFWMCTFACELSKQDKFESQFLSWADSIVID